MKKLLSLLLIGLVGLFVAGCGGKHAATALPERPDNYVVDTTKTLTAEETSELEKELIALHKTGKAEMYVVMVDSIGDEPIEEYSMKIAESWRPGNKETDNGLILLIAKNDRKMRMEVGRGLEGTITDGMAGQAISCMKTPFKEKKYAEGIKACVDITSTFLGNPEVAKAALAARANAKQFKLSHFMPLLKGFVIAFLIFEGLVFLFFWFLNTEKRKDDYGCSWLRAFLTLSVIGAAIGMTIEKTVDGIISTLDTVLSCGGLLGGGSSSDGGDFGGGFDGGGSSDSW